MVRPYAAKRHGAGPSAASPAAVTPAPGQPARTHVQSAAKRWRKKPLPVGLSVCSIKRLARRAGVKRLSPLVIPDTRTAVRDFLSGLVSAAIKYVEHGRRRTVTVMDVLRALKLNGRTLYGYGDYTPEQIVQKRVARLRAPLPVGLLDALRAEQQPAERPPTPVAMAPVVEPAGDEAPAAAEEPAAPAPSARGQRVLTETWTLKAIAEVYKVVGQRGENMVGVAWLHSQVNEKLAAWQVRACERANLQLVLRAMDSSGRVMLDADKVYFI
eukprot:jgi/Tetstr1/421688/TSEL_012627.t1